MLRPYLQLVLLCTVSLVAVQNASAQSSYSSHPEPLQPRIEAGAKAGTERTMGTMEGWMPIVQDDDSVLYGDIRWMADDEENQEGNLGIGYRAMQGDHIVGVHGWIDRRRTDRGSNFHQITGGVEFMKEDWDIKANAYVPLNKQREYTTANLGSETPYMAGTGLFVDTNGVVIEEAQPGGDIELGYRIPAFEKNIDAIRVYGGGYAFIGDQSDDTIGGRVRASVDINPLINVGARFQYDEPRGSQGFIEATLRFPFKAKKRFQEHGLRARLDESPERDIDIVTGAQIDNGLRKEVVNVESGATQRVIHVDNSVAGGGNGSAENPYNTLAAAQAAMLDNDVIYVHAGNGTTSGMDQGITINKNNVQLIGSGTDFVFNTDKFTTRRPGQKPAEGTIIAAKTVAPVITNTQISSDGIVFNNVNAVVSGINVSGAQRDGIRVIIDSVSIDNVHISDVTTSMNAGRGIFVLANNAGSINNVLVSNTEHTNNNGTYSGDFLTGVRGRGVEIAAFNNGNINTAYATENLVSGSTVEGIVVQAQSGAHLHQAYVTANEVETSQGTAAGITVQAASLGQLDYALIQGNSSNNNQGTGILAIAVGGTLTTADIINNTVEGNGAVSAGGAGMIVQSASNGTISQSHVVNNNITNNKRQGLYILANTNSSLVSSVSENTITGNGTLSVNPNFYYGINIKNDSTGTFNVDLGGGALGSIGGNRIYNNFYRDISIDSRPGTAAATPGATISAQHNWWGVNTGLNQGTRTTFDNGSASPGSSIDATNHLTTDPGI